MSKMTALRPDDKEWYLDFIRGAIDLDRSDIDTSAANRLVLALLHDHEASTSNIEEQIKARRILDACAEDGSRSLVYGVIREDNTAVRLPNTGVLHLPARIGTRKKGSKGWQQTLWYDMDWAQFDEFLERQTERHSADATKLFAMRGVRTLKEQYPDTASVGEAIRAAGLDPLNLDLEEMDMAS